LSNLREETTVKRIVADPRKCLACRACEFACALAHAQSEDLLEAIFVEGAKPRIYIESAGGLSVPLQCRHCEDAPCVRVCPSGALSRPSEAGPVLADQEKCIGCAFCVQACPFGVVSLGAQGKVVIKCDLCIRRQAAGLQPACVAACPVGALSLEEVAENAKRARARAAAEVAAASAEQ
jgi:carbon-monoxide dehydrogenase iron sulfur subunit